jgi:hypothetical protein
VFLSRLGLQGLPTDQEQLAPGPHFYYGISSIAVYLLLPEQPILNT